MKSQGNDVLGMACKQSRARQQLDLFDWPGRRPANDNDVFASAPSLPRPRKVVQEEVNRIAKLERKLTARSLTMLDLVARVGPPQGYASGE